MCNLDEEELKGKFSRLSLKDLNIYDEAKIHERVLKIERIKKKIKVGH